MGTRTKITISRGKVCFDRQEMEIDDSANMSYMFVNEAHRTLSLRYVGMEDGTNLPIWEFEVFHPSDNHIVLNRQIIGYRTFEYEGGSIHNERDTLELAVAA